MKSTRILLNVLLLCSVLRPTLRTHAAPQLGPAKERAAATVRLLWRCVFAGSVLLGMAGIGQHRIVQASSNAAIARVVYVALGDSYSTGQASAAGPTTTCYPALLARHLPHGARYLNLASWANTLYQAILIDLPVALAAHPTLITVWLGGGDVTFGGRTAKEFRADMDTLLTALQRTHARIFVANIPDLRILHHYRGYGAEGGGSPEVGLAYNAAIAAEAKRHGATVVDVYAASHTLWDHPELTIRDVDILTIPNARGEAVLATLFYRVMHSHGAL